MRVFCCRTDIKVTRNRGTEAKAEFAFDGGYAVRRSPYSQGLIPTERKRTTMPTVVKIHFKGPMDRLTVRVSPDEITDALTEQGLLNAKDAGFKSASWSTAPYFPGEVLIRTKSAEESKYWNRFVKGLSTDGGGAVSRTALKALKAAGGRAWNRDGASRLYFDVEATCKRYGIVLGVNQILLLDKIYLDLNTGEWHLTSDSAIDKVLLPALEALSSKTAEG